MKRRPLSQEPRYALNAICPYFTMFPLELPLRILGRHRTARVVLDPFCGRGTTLFAARVRGIRGVGIDVSPVAVAISQAKLAHGTTEATIALAKELQTRVTYPDIPDGEFWRIAFHKETLRELCVLRDALRRVRTITGETALLRGALLGILHGPLTSTGSYLSNQMPRTFAPKPRYAVKFWTRKGFSPPRVAILDALARKLRRLEFGADRLSAGNIPDVILGDAAECGTFRRAPRLLDVVITSPPYYGMRTYVPDQWLRHWLLGGPAEVEYGARSGLPSSSPKDFVEALGRAWRNVAIRARDDLHLHVRFGAIPSRTVEVKQMLLHSLESSGIRWQVVSLRGARNAEAGKRQVWHMRDHSEPVDEVDLHAVAS